LRPKLAKDWSQHVSGNGKEYYYNAKTKETTWTAPLATGAEAAGDGDDSKKKKSKKDKTRRTALSGDDGAKEASMVDITADKATSVSSAASATRDVELTNANSNTDSNSASETRNNVESAIPFQSPKAQTKRGSIYDVTPTEKAVEPVFAHSATKAAALRRKSTNLNTTAVESYVTAVGEAKGVDKVVKKRKSVVFDKTGGHTSMAEESREDENTYEVENFSAKTAKSEVVSALVRKGSVTFKNKIPNPTGMSEFLRNRTESGPEVLSRLLTTGEIVDAQFDCYYGIPAGYPWYINVLLVIFTGGLYGIVLLVRYCFECSMSKETSEFICACFGTCSPPIYFRRLKMSITNKGRIILWKLEGRESCEASSIGLRQNFGVVQSVQVLTTRQIRQVSQSFSCSHGPTALCCCCCCRSHQGSVDLYFNAFERSHSSFLRVGTISEFYTSTKAFVSDIVRKVRDHTVGGSSNGGGFWTRSDVDMGDQKTPLLLRVLTDVSDEAYEHDPQQMLKALSELQAAVMVFLPSNVHDPWVNSAVMDASSASQANVHFYKSTKLVPIVDSEGNMAIPASMVPFTEDEVLISAVGQIGKCSSTESVLNCLSLSALYWLWTRRNTYEHSAILLTTKRMIEVLVHHPRGIIPDKLGGEYEFSLQIRSLFPGDILSGYIFKTENGIIESSLHTQGGNITVVCPGNLVYFGRKMQRVADRIKPLNVDLTLLPKKLSASSSANTVDEARSRRRHSLDMRPSAKKLESEPVSETQTDDFDIESAFEMDPDLESSEGRSTSSGAGSGTPKKQTEKQRRRRRDSNLAGREYSLCEAEKDSRALGNMPLHDDEQVIFRFKGSQEWRPCLAPAWLSQQLYLFFCCTPLKPYRCFFTSLFGKCCCRPLSSCLTCGLRPRKKFPEIIVTDTTLYYNAAFYSNPPCDCGAGGYITSLPVGYFISWIPIRSVDDQEVEMEMRGVFNMGKCGCCGLYGCVCPTEASADDANKGKNTTVGCNVPLPHCPVFSSYQMKIGTTEGFAYRLYSILKDHNWTQDYKLAKMQALLGVIQVRYKPNITYL